MDILLGVAVGGVLILSSVTLRAGVGATWLSRLRAKLRPPDAPDVPAATAIDPMGDAAVPLTTVLRAADIPPGAAPPAASLLSRRPALPPRRASRDPRTALSRAAGPAGAVRQPLRSAEHDALCALLEACSIVPAQAEPEAETVVHIPRRAARASEAVAAAQDRRDQAEDESHRAVEEVFAIAAAQLRRRSEEEMLRETAGADTEGKVWPTKKGPSPATREVTRIADELAQHWAVEAVNRTAEQARVARSAGRELWRSACHDRS